MANIIANACGLGIALVANTAKTLLQLKAPANQGLKILEVKIMGDASAGGTDPPVKYRITRSTANFGTGTAVTPVAQDPRVSETLQASCAKDFSVEPTTPTDTLDGYKVNPETGLLDVPPQLLQQIVKGGGSWQLEGTSTGTPTVSVYVKYEE